MSHESFWLENPSVLLSNWTFLPGENDTVEAKLNAITRLVLVIAIVLALLKWKHWFVFLIVAMVLIIFVYLLTCKTCKQSSDSHKQQPLIENFNEDMSNFDFYSSTAADAAVLEQKPKAADTTTVVKMIENKVDIDDMISVTPLMSQYEHDLTNSRLYTYIVMPEVDVLDFGIPLHGSSKITDQVETKLKVETKVMRKEKTPQELMMEFYANDGDDEQVERDRKALFDTTL